MNFTPHDPRCVFDPPGDFVPDWIEGLVLFACVAIVLALVMTPHRARDEYEQLEELALKFSHKKKAKGSPEGGRK